MLADGRIVEEGSHEELMRKGGRYATMFNAQRRCNICGHNSSEVKHDGISQVFQDFGRYRLTVRDNVRISDYTKGLDDREILRTVRECPTTFWIWPKRSTF